MNINKKIIPRLEIKNGNLIKGMRMEGLRVVSNNPSLYIKKYLHMSVKEILIEDIVASLFNKKIDFKTIRKLSNDVNIPVSYAGGIKNIQDIKKLFKYGVDKIYINSNLENNFKLLNESSKIYGSQSIGALIQTKKIFNDWYIFFQSGRIFSKINLREWIKKINNSDAGEIILSSIMNDGMQNGPDFELLEYIEDLKIKVPIIYSGGVRNSSDVRNILKKNINSVAISHSLHFEKYN
jgi:cyclase